MIGHRQVQRLIQLKMRLRLEVQTQVQKESTVSLCEPPYRTFSQAAKAPAMTGDLLPWRARRRVKGVGVAETAVSRMERRRTVHANLLHPTVVPI